MGGLKGGSYVSTWFKCQMQCCMYIIMVHTCVGGEEKWSTQFIAGSRPLKQINCE